MTTYGLTSTGFVEKDADTILTELADAQRADIDPALDTSAESLIGQLNGIFGAKLRELWELAGSVARARDPRNATFDTLDGVCALNAITRKAATRSTVLLTVSLTAGTTLPAGSVAHVSGAPSNRWRTLLSITNSTGSTQSYGVGAESEATGPVTVAPSTITVIATPRTGWLSVTNGSLVTLGRAVEGDPELRRRRLDELQGIGSSPVGAIRAALSKVAGVTGVVVFHNPTDLVDADGLPPHSVEAMVTGGVAADVAAALWAAHAAGIRTHGSIPITLTDDNGQSRVVRFTAPSERAIYVKAIVTRGPGYAGEAAVKAAVIALGALLVAGESVKVAAITCAVLDVAGVADVQVLLGLSTAARAARNVSIGVRERAVFADARIEVVAS